MCEHRAQNNKDFQLIKIKIFQGQQPTEQPEDAAAAPPIVSPNAIESGSPHTTTSDEVANNEPFEEDWSEEECKENTSPEECSASKKSQIMKSWWNALRCHTSKLETNNNNLEITNMQLETDNN